MFLGRRLRIQKQEPVWPRQIRGLRIARLELALKNIELESAK